MSENTAFYGPALESAAFSSESFNRTPLNGDRMKAERLSDEALVELMYAIACEPGRDAERDVLAAIITDRLIETYGCDEVSGPTVRTAD